MRPHRSAVLLVGLFAFMHCSTMGKIENVQDTWRWTSFTTRNGLPSNVIYDVRETANSVVWASTARGLAWYDGYQWHAVGPDLGLPAERITVMLAEGDTSILVVMARRLFTGNRGGFTEIELDQDTAHASFIAGAVLPTGRALLLTTDGRAYVRDADLLVPAPQMDGSGAIQITDIQAQPSGRVLISTTQGLYAGDGHTWSQVLGFGDERFEIPHVAENGQRDGAVWVVQPREHNGLWVWKHGGQPHRVRSETAPSNPHLILYDDGGVVQVDEVGVLRIHSEEFGDESIPAPSAFTGFSFARFRSNGDLWVGGDNGLHLCRLTSNRWASIEPPALQPATAVLSLLRKQDGSLWIGTNEGIQVYGADGSSRLITTGAGYPLQVITGLAEDADGAVWVSSGFSFTGALRCDG